MGFLTFKLFCFSAQQTHSSRIPAVNASCQKDHRSCWWLRMARWWLRSDLFPEKRGLIAFHLRNPIIRTHLKQLFVLTIRGDSKAVTANSDGCGTFLWSAHITCTLEITKSFASSGGPPLQMKSNRMINDSKVSAWDESHQSAIWRLISRSLPVRTFTPERSLRGVEMSLWVIKFSIIIEPNWTICVATASIALPNKTYTKFD